MRILYGTGKESSVEIFAKYGFLPLGNQKNDIEWLSSYLSTSSTTADGFHWSTSLEDDKKSLHQITMNDDTFVASLVDKRQKQILELRVYLKELAENNII